MLKYLNTYFRFIWLWLIMMLIFPVIVTVALVSTTTYTASASLWVDRPLFNIQNINIDQGNSWDSPAAQMAGLLSELLGTRSFLSNVIDTTSYRTTVSTDAQRNDLMDSIKSRTKVNGDKYRLIIVTYTDSTPQKAVEVLDSIVARYRFYYDQQINQQGEGALAYYQKLVNATGEDLQKATNDLKTFIDQHPNEIGKDASSRAVSAVDLQYAALSQNLDAVRTRYNDASRNLDQVLTTYGAYTNGQNTTLRVQDNPALLDSTLSKLRQYGIGIGIGLVIAIVLSIIGVIVLTLRDKTIRFRPEAQKLVGKGRVLEIPNYRAVNRKKGKGLLQAQIEYVEGGSNNKTRARRSLTAGTTLRQTLATQIVQAQPGELS
ncbi:MAG TPA: hypothetical protein VH186_32690 [Chloroflexia bacterium]|nr:hypothetical protein [Chloroflexia bacterium]